MIPHSGLTTTVLSNELLHQTGQTHLEALFASKCGLDHKAPGPAEALGPLLQVTIASK